MRFMMRPVLIVIGSLSVVLAIVGILVPILPTTPFLLLAAACYARSSDRFLNWLLHNRWFGTYIRKYREGRGMPRLTKILTLAALWATLILSGVFGVTALWLRLLLLGVGIGVTLHLLRIPTYPPSTSDDGDAAIPVAARSPEET